MLQSIVSDEKQPIQNFTLNQLNLSINTMKTVKSFNNINSHGYGSHGIKKCWYMR